MVLQGGLDFPEGLWEMLQNCHGYAGAGAGFCLGFQWRGGLVRITTTQDQDNIATMFETTNVALDDGRDFWKDIPAMADAVNRAETGTAEIRKKAGDQAPTGDTDQKAAMKSVLEELMLHVADQLSAMAAKKGDHLLAAKVDITKSTADRLGSTDLLIFAKGVAKAAAENAEELATFYKIPASELAALDAAITKFDGMKTAPRDATVQRKVATLSLPEAIIFVRGIYRNELDKMMTRFKKTQPDFYKAYFAARVVVHRAATHAAAKKTEAKPG